MSAFIPEPVVKRLPMYCRYLKELERENILFVSSTEIAKRMGLTASMVRQDVNVFGGVGRQGCGYPVAELRMHIERLLGLHKPHTMIIIGVGNLGRALIRYKAFEKRGFTTIALFDKTPPHVARGGQPVVLNISELESFLAQQHVDIAILTIPASDAQEMAQRLYQNGVRGFWNFAPVDVQLPEDASVLNVHLDESLEMLSFYMENKE